MSGAARRRLALMVSAAGAMLVALDGTVLILAQPSVRRDFGANVARMQWTSTGYLLAVAALLVIAGRLGDRYGHRRLLLCGLFGFAGASAGIALAPGIGWVIGLRIVQGVFGALLQPATLALLRLTHPGNRLGTAVAIRTSAIGVAAAAGPCSAASWWRTWAGAACSWSTCPSRWRSPRSPSRCGYPHLQAVNHSGSTSWARHWSRACSPSGSTPWSAYRRTAGPAERPWRAWSAPPSVRRS